MDLNGEYYTDLQLQKAKRNKKCTVWRITKAYVVRDAVLVSFYYCNKTQRKAALRS